MSRVGSRGSSVESIRESWETKKKAKGWEGQKERRNEDESWQTNKQTDKQTNERTTRQTG